MTVSLSEQLLEGALGLAARGIPVLSLRPRSKVPAHRNWPGLGMLAPNIIRAEWELNPDANVGVLCGPDALDGDGLIVVDVDLPDGPATLDALEERHGELPATSMVATPSGGSHRYYRGIAVSWNPGPGLEIRSAGRQCAAPPSVHPNGGRYAWVREERFAQAPAWVSACQKAPRPARATTRPERSGLRDPVLEVTPPVYFKALCGLIRDGQGFVQCPVHPFTDAEPSCRVYDTAERGWFCYGEECRKGGDVVTLAALLAGIATPLVGYQFMCALDYLRGRLLL
jgi:hypothetical protein